MTPYWSDDHLTLYGGDCRDVLRELPAESVHCVVTSPPYWGLRDYGTAMWEGGDEACDHRNDTQHQRQGSTSQRAGRSNIDEQRNENFRSLCGKCGATRIDSQLGLEPTPEEYVANMVAVFREVRRVLRKDGTLWLNLGDSYVAGQGGRQSSVGEMPAKPLRSEANPRARDDVDTGSWAERDATVKMTPARGTTTLKPKDLVGVPWRVAFALQADGWYLRSDVIWSKPNPMPESVTDRPTKAHEYLFLLSKSARYYYDADAVREDAVRPGDVQTFGGMKARDADPIPADDPRYRNGKEQWGRTITSGLNGRNLRSVWTIATEPYPGAHFATFPRKLVEPCVKAGTSERGVCPECGAPWVRETSVAYVKSPVHGNGSVIGRHEASGANGWDGAGLPRLNKEVTTTGWRPSCGCKDEPDVTLSEWLPYHPVPAVVLDPFAGSGTTLLVAQSLGRRGIGIDLSPDYLRQALDRNRQTPLGLVG
jgi:DNA modification methylase